MKTKRIKWKEQNEIKGSLSLKVSSLADALSYSSRFSDTIAIISLLLILLTTRLPFEPWFLKTSAKLGIFALALSGLQPSPEIFLSFLCLLEFSVQMAPCLHIFLNSSKNNNTSILSYTYLLFPQSMSIDWHHIWFFIFNILSLSLNYRNFCFSAPYNTWQENGQDSAYTPQIQNRIYQWIWKNTWFIGQNSESGIAIGNQKFHKRFF